MTPGGGFVGYHDRCERGGPEGALSFQHMPACMQELVAFWFFYSNEKTKIIDFEYLYGCWTWLGLCSTLPVFDIGVATSYRSWKVCHEKLNQNVCIATFGCVIISHDHVSFYAVTTFFRKTSRSWYNYSGESHKIAVANVYTPLLRKVSLSTSAVITLAIPSSELLCQRHHAEFHNTPYEISTQITQSFKSLRSYLLCALSER